MGKILRTAKRLVRVVIPGALVAGGALALYKEGKKRGMHELCDWCDNHGSVVIQNDLGPDFQIVKQDME